MSKSLRIVPWLESLYADAIFGLRQVLKNKMTASAAILSLALAIGSCAAAFRLIDAMLWRPLPVTAPERLYVLLRGYAGPDGKFTTGDNCAYPMFRKMRALVKDQAELIAVSGASRTDLTYGSDQDTEKAYQQYVSGWMFPAFGIRPAVGRLFSENDDLTPGAHPYAVLSHDYWTRRFGQDPKVVGQSFRMDNKTFQIVGVAEGPFTGTEPGIVTDVFISTMMMENNAIVRSDYLWFRTFVQLKPGVNISPVREKLRAEFRAFLEENVKTLGGMPKLERDGYLSQKLLLNPASSGVSGMQKAYGTALSVLGVLVTLVLLICCTNVANLMTAQAMARQREMALRVSIGAGRWRLVQLVVIECAWIAFLASCLGACFALWAAPFVSGMLGTPETPIRLVMPMDWRMLAFGMVVAQGVTVLFGLGPALRASSVKPAAALRGGDPHVRPRMMHLAITVQVVFCVFVLFVGGLFMTTAERLTHQPMGFSADRMLAVETVVQQAQPESSWQQVANEIRALPGVEAVAICEWPLMAGGSWNGFISVSGAPPGPVASYFLAVSPEWRELMKIPLLQGRDLRRSDTEPGSALVNEAFARQYFRSENPVGKSFEVVSNEGSRTHYEIAGLVGDARYKDMREAIQPAAYFPFQLNYSRANFMVRTASQNPLTMASTLRLSIPRARAGFRVSNIWTQKSLAEQSTIQARLLAVLALFFGAVALCLAGVGLYGVLDYSVLQSRREIGIRIAIGARPGEIAWRVTTSIFGAVMTGAMVGTALGIVSVRFIEALLYRVKVTDLDVLALPAVMMFLVALVATSPAVIRAVRISPATLLRSE